MTIDQRIHVYQLVELLPAGGVGETYRARVTAPGGRVAEGSEVRFRLIDLQGIDPAVEQAALADLSSAQSISGEYVATPLDYAIDEQDGVRRLWCVSAWSEGRRLDQVLDAAGTVPDPLTESVGKQALLALEAMHSADLFEVGVALDTLLVKPDSSVLLLDPGLARLTRALRPTEGEPTTEQRCAAPESLEGDAAPAVQADLFALGCVLYRCITGRWHRPGDEVGSFLLTAVTTDGARPVMERPHSSAFLSELTYALLRLDVGDRIASVAELLQIFDDRRKSEWWNSLAVKHDTYLPVASGPDLEQDEPAPLPIPAPALPLDEEWITRLRLLPRPIAPHVTECVGREAELDALVQIAQRLPEEGGEVLLLEGPPGVGKSCLLDAFLARLRKSRPTNVPIVLFGEHRNLGIGRPLHAFSQAVTGLFGDGREIDELALQPLLGDATGIAVPFAAFVSGRARPSGVAALTRASLASGFAHILRSLAERRPVVFIIENLHWADPEGLDLFGYLARVTGALPLLLLATYRPVGEGAPLSGMVRGLEAARHVSKARLEPLMPEEARAVAAQILEPGPGADELGSELAEAAENIPLRLVETTRLLVDRGVLEDTEDGKLRRTSDAPVGELPRTTGALFSARLAGLGDRERRFLALAAIQGVLFDSEVVRLAMRASRDDCERMLERLEKGRFVRGRAPAWRFSSNELYDQVLDALNESQEPGLHSATAEAFIESRNPGHRPAGETHGVLAYRVAWHFLLAGEAERGLEYVPSALGHLEETWRIGDAERLAAQACRAMRGDKQRAGQLIDMLLRRSELLATQGRREKQRELLDEAFVAARTSNDEAREANVRSASAQLEFDTNHLRQAREEARHSLKAAQAAKDTRMESHCHFLLGRIAFQEARYQQARKHMQRVLELSRVVLDSISEAEALQALGDISQGVGSFEHAEELQRQAMNIYRRSGELAQEGETLMSLGNVSSAVGDYVKAESYLRRALAIQRSLGDGYGEARVLGHLGTVLQDAGRYLEAREAHQECLEVARDMGARDHELVALLNIATTQYVLGHLDDARDFYGDALRAAREVGDRALQGYALTGLGDVARQNGEWAIAGGLFERAIRLFRRTGADGGLAAALLASGRSAMFAGNARHAVKLLDEASQMAAKRSLRVVQALAEGHLALLRARSGAHEDARLRLAQAHASLKDLPGSEVARVELFFLESLTLRVTGDGGEADRKILQAEKLLDRVTTDLPEDDQHALLTMLSPHREIVAGAAAVRETARDPLNDTAPVE